MTDAEEEVSPFPEWAIDLDPVLEKAHKNHLYMIFRERRRTYGGLLKSHGPLDWRSQIRLIAHAALWALTIWGFTVSGPYGIFFLAVGLPLIKFILPTGVQESRRLPYRVKDLYADEGWLKAGSIDLYLAGANGRDVAEAIHLEQWWPRFVGFTLLYIATLVFIVLLFDDLALRHGAFWDGLIILSSGWLAWRGFPSAYVWFSRERAYREMRYRIARWRGELKWYLIPLREFAHFFAWGMIGYVFICGAGLIMFAVLQQGGIFGVSAMMLLASWFLPGWADEKTSRYLQNMAHECYRANLAFDLYMNERVIGDPLGRTWAIWKHQPGRQSFRKENEHLEPLRKEMVSDFDLHFADAHKYEVEEANPEQNDLFERGEHGQLVLKRKPADNSIEPPAGADNDINKPPESAPGG